MTVVDEINRARIRYGLKPVRRSRSLRGSAGLMARWLQHKPFAHRDRIYVARSWMWAGEVLAKGDFHPRTVVRAWLDSPPHKAILLFRDARAVGVARRGDVWVAHFGRLG